LDSVAFGKNKTDAKIRLDYKTTRLKSSIKVCEEDGECSWNQEFLVPAQKPIIGGRIVFKIYDDDLSGDEIVGSIHFELKDIVPDANEVAGRLHGKFDWKNIYGSPLKVRGKMTDKMNENPEIASFWKGRILCQVMVEKSEKPKLLVRDIDAEAIEEAKSRLLNRTFAAQLFIAGAIGLPYDNKEFQVSVRIAEKEWWSGEPKTKKAKYNRFNVKPTDEDSIFRMPYLSIADMGTVMIYLHHKFTLGSKRICFWKGSIHQFTERNPTLKWIEMQPDLAVGEVKQQYKAGIIGLRFSIVDVTAEGEVDWNNYPHWAKKIPKRPPNHKIRIFCW
jgi:hypothetical protein